MKYYLSLGSNIGNRLNFLKKAIELLAQVGTVEKLSSIYETSPVGVVEPQGMYLNMVLILRSGLAPEEMLKSVKNFESKLGRKIKESHLKPREIDIDILFCDDVVVNKDILTVPHREAGERKFVLLPIAEIDPEFRHPVTGMSVKDMSDRCSDKGDVKLYMRSDCF